MLNGSTSDLKRMPRFAAALVVLTVIALCGFIDYITGYEISVFALYIIPIVMAMHWFGSRMGGAVAVVCALVWLAADVGAGHRYSHAWFLYWNALHRLLFFLCVAVAFHHVRATLRRSSKRLHAFTRALPICTQCHRIGAESGYWQRFESYLVEHGGAQPQHRVCPDCARESYARAGYFDRASSG